MTYREAFLWGKQILEAADIEEAELDASYLLWDAAGIGRAYYYAHRDEDIQEENLQSFKEHIRKHGKRIPLQHILGVQEFMGYSFFVNQDVLIPRSDTECLIEAMEEKRDRLPSDIQLLDMCTGSGCILLTLLLRQFSKMGVGVDISEKALYQARRNADNLGVLEQATLIKSNLFADVEGSFDVLVSNPPYITTEEIEHLEPEVKDFEPRIALDGREDGLFFYKQIIADCHKVLKEGGWLFFEIGNTQAQEVCKEMKQKGFADIEVKQDLNGMDRVVLGRFIG